MSRPYPRMLFGHSADGSAGFGRGCLRICLMGRGWGGARQAGCVGLCGWDERGLDDDEKAGQRRGKGWDGSRGGERRRGEGMSGDRSGDDKTERDTEGEQLVGGC